MILGHSRWSLCFPTAVAFVEAIGPAAIDGVVVDTAEAYAEFLGLLDYFADVAMKVRYQIYRFIYSLNLLSSHCL